MHLFPKGYRGPSFSSRPGVKLDEAACYMSLAKEHHVRCALVVGYAAEPWCADNNRFLARMVVRHPWVRPTAFVPLDDLPTVARLERFRRERFVGISLYVFGKAACAAVGSIRDDVWSWIEAHRWLISVNSRDENWLVWQPILARHPQLRLIVSHLGLPPRRRLAPNRTETRRALATVLALARFPRVRVKLSGFYALSDPGHDYPHRAAWPYVEALAETFTTRRLLWASDFSPCLDWLTFPQTFGLFDQMPFLTVADRQRIQGANLVQLLREVRR